MAELARTSDLAQDRNPRDASTTPLVRRLSQEFEGSRPPEGFMAATGDITSTLVARHTQLDGQPPTPKSEKRGDRNEFLEEPSRQPTAAIEVSPIPSSDEVTIAVNIDRDSEPKATACTEPFPNGYHFPPKYSWQETTRQGLVSFWKFFITPMGFFWTIYGLNVVAWGGMLFLLLCNAAPAMCYPTCDDINSPRRKWIEWDSQILTALFCVTAFGLAPWRFRDLYYLLQYRVLGKRDGLRRLAGIHRGWFRLPGSQDLPPDVGPEHVPDDVPRDCVPVPESSTPNAPLTGTRAPATKVWKLDFVIWTMVWNTFAQCALCGIMWGMNRYTRPSWATGFLVAIACVIAMIGGLVMFLEGRKVKSVEGVPLTERDLEKLARDKELGIPHYNNIKDKQPQDKSEKSKDTGSENRAGEK